MGTTALGALLDLLLPATCGGCEAPGVVWCASCNAGVGPPREVTLPGTPVVTAAGRYTGALRTAVLGYKERDRRELVGALAGLLAAITPPGMAPLWLVPAPSRPSAARARGGDHMLRLARALAGQLEAAGRPSAAAPALRLRSGAHDSVGLDAASREANLAGRMRVRRRWLPPGGAAVVLLDDVVTTGATVRSCVSTLGAADVRQAAVLVLCDASRSSLSGSFVKRAVAEP